MDKLYELVVMCMGEEIDRFTTKSFECAKDFYTRENQSDGVNQAVVTYINGERIRTPEAWKLFGHNMYTSKRMVLGKIIREAV